MKFKEFALLCVGLKSTSKKLFKIQLLYEYSLKFSGEEMMRVYDVLSGNFFREISKKEVGISFRTIIDVLGEMYQMNSKTLHSHFQRHGDMFKLIDEFNTQKSSLIDSSKLSVEEFMDVMVQISNISGSSAMSYKKQKLLSLFSKTYLLEERQVLSAILSDLLKIGTNEGVLHEAFVFSYFPKIEDFHYYSQVNDCWLYSSSIESEYLKFKRSLNGLDLSESNSAQELEVVSIDSIEQLMHYSFPYSAYLVRSDMLSGKEIYEQLKMYFERMYSFIVSYREVYKQLTHNASTFLTPPIVFGKALQVMLGPRLYSFEEAQERVNFPVFCDYKYDGLRLIIQNEYGKVKLFSRNLEDLTSQFQEVVQFVQDNFSHLSCVLDGECIGFHKNTSEQVEFQELSKRIMTKSHNLKVNITIGLRLFDILKFNDELVYLKPLKERQKILRSLFLNQRISVEKRQREEDVAKKLKEYFGN
ncbi:MAG: hypothetical protein ACLFPL_03915 [Candidatus Nanoarchaeia archaeon]